MTSHILTYEYSLHGAASFLHMRNFRQGGGGEGPTFRKILTSQNKTRAPRGTDRSPEYSKHFCLKLDFLADCHISDISPNSKQSRYFNSGYEDAFGLLLLRSYLKKKSYGEKASH